ncbi:unnamed protein product [Leuciscus chuanchicus]
MRHLISKRGGSTKFRAAPLEISEEQEKAAKEALCPPSLHVTGEEEDIFSRGDFLSLRGQIQVLRMAEVQGSPVPVLDLSLRCGQKLLDVSLWREEALCELYLGDETVERKEETLEVQVVGVSEEDGCIILLCEDFTEFTVPVDLYHGSVEELIHKLPVHLKINHVKKRVLSVNFKHEE